MRYLPVTDQEREEMLKKIGASSLEELFSSIPEKVRLKKQLNLPEAKSEMELDKLMSKLADMNTGSNMSSFLGGGCYAHYAPAAIDQMLLRSEFYTAYTPYQPEISQGTLQSIFEFQTMISKLMKMDATNASMYDGATAAAEAIRMAAKINHKRKKVVIAGTIHPHYIETIRTYSEGIIDEIEIMDIDSATGTIKESELAKIDTDTICVLFQYPNYFGVMENVFKISETAKSKKALVVSIVTEMTMLGATIAPGDFGADIAVGEAQSLGLAPNFGGPGIGTFSTASKHVRKMPGRLVGKTTDKDGKECFVLTLAAREQHIKREKATSNICSNQGLMTLAVGMYLAIMGKNGVKDVALMNLKRREYMLNKITAETEAVKAFSAPSYNEFTILLPQNANKVAEKMAEKGILAGIPLSKYFPELDNALTVAVTELNSYEEIDRYVKTLAEIIGG